MDQANTVEEGENGPDARQRILVCAAELLRHGGREALTTRAVATAAGVQQPTIYRLFGDKDALLDAVAEYGFLAYLKQKSPNEPGQDPIDALRAGWDLHVGFGLANPAIFSIMYGDPRPGKTSPAAAKAVDFLRQRMRLLAASGRLRVSEERAANLIRAGGCGTVFTLLAMPEAERDLDLSIVAREAVLATIITQTPQWKASGVVSAAIALRATLSETNALTASEQRLLSEWLARIAAPGGEVS
ncbi:TetR/AcrR family transcriptional regulator [Propylenella binzhouense]|uniref:TetR/AcrR family transcriptional regulator n=1 Tax=Propylenella binzhouense TaxID=2555902 RepID=A0A964WSH6_9HYPH|nr:TetR/AcrR family transcriptional regulator [Propylenella binzhouense]MYZ46881.1 TetR/AcrR family transcriptional regulator [Propylenella binzhouense]